MSLDLEQRLRVFLASSPQGIARLEVVELSHSAMTRIYRFWRQPRPGQVVTEAGMVDVESCNIEVAPAGNKGDLDQQFTIAIDTTDKDDLLRGELQRIPLNTTEKAVVTFREYLSDNLTQPQSKAVLQAESITYRLGAATISAVSPRLNVTRTGEIYAPKDIPMLRGFL